MVERSSGIKAHREVDIVVIGAGGSGLSAAVAAAESGAKVCLLEKRKIAGGNSNMAEGLFAAESPAQKRLCIDARKEDLFKMAMKYAHWQLNAKLVSTFIDKSGDTIRWFEEKGLKFSVLPLFPNQTPLTWHCPDKGGAAIIKTLLKCFNDLGGTVLYNTSAKKILKDRSGKVIGVLAEKDGSELTIKAKSTIISTGGYAGNKELLKKYCPFYSENYINVGLPHTGDGLLMAIEAGADTEGLGTLQLEGPAFPRILRSDFIRRTTEEPDTVWVNIRGERYVDEGCSFNLFEAVNAIKRQPGQATFTLLDSGIKRRIIQTGFILPFFGPLYGGHYSEASTLEKEIEAAASKGRAIISNSWKEVARWIGAEEKVLTATIDEYNAGCDRGFDSIFAKDRRYLQPLRTPPYYALKCDPPEYLTTIGGIRVNHRMEVVDKMDRPIPGLYCGGNDAGGWESDTYNANLSGTTLGFAFTSGRIAGENAFKNIRPK